MTEGGKVSACPECNDAIATGGLTLGEIVHCNDCGAELELVKEDPPVLELAPEIEEDCGE
jgi:alpha-aminoadipate carrier protein LysW